MTLKIFKKIEINHKNKIDNFHENDNINESK